jgi:MFS family permease
MGTLMLFATNGLTFASLIPRYPEIKADLGASQTLWGLAVGIGPIGGLALGLATARLMSRFGSRNVAAWPQILSTAGLLLMANAPHVGWVFVAMIAMSAFDAVTDTAMNYQALRVQEMYKRSIINTFHGWWSVGAVLGGFIGSAMAQWRVDINLQASLTMVVLALVCALSWSLMLPGRDTGTDRSEAGGDQRKARVPATTWLHIVGLGLLGALAGGIEIGGSTWAPLYMDAQFNSTPFIAGMGFTILMVAETAGRLIGDLIVNRFGQAFAVAQGSVICLVGMAVAIAWPTTASTLIGFAAAGWGVATIIPLAMNVADSLPGVRSGVGLTIATWVMRLGFMLFPIGIGALGDAVALRWAMICLPAGALVMLALVPLVGAGRRRRAPEAV